MATVSGLVWAAAAAQKPITVTNVQQRKEAKDGELCKFMTFP
ncbi:UNVERIFIED_ORG: hypothetical protein J2W38_000217 [Variovorax paradoxus]|nr:hypothetical protein [Variovorax paradoxus]